MKTSFGKKIAIICLSAAVACGVGVGINNIKNVEAASHKYNVQSILDVYGVNTTIKVTDAPLSDLEIEQGVKAFPKTHNIGGEVSRKATIDVLTYPDGIVKKVGETFSLSQVGVYTISYKLVETGVSTIYYDTFKVNNSFYTLSSDSGTVVAKSIFTDIETISGLTDDQINQIIIDNGLTERDAISADNIDDYISSAPLTFADLSNTLINKILAKYKIAARQAITQEQVNLYLAADTNGKFRLADNVKTYYDINKLSDATVALILAKYNLADKSKLTQNHLADYFTNFYLEANELTDAQKQDIKAKFGLTGDTISSIAIENYFKGYFLTRDRLSNTLINNIKAAYTLDSNNAITQDIINDYFSNNVILPEELTDAQAKVIVEAYVMKDTDALTQDHINRYVAEVEIVNEDLTSAQADAIIANYGLTKKMAITKDHIQKYFGDAFPRKSSGIQLNLTAGTTVTINEAVDLTELKYNDSGMADLITFNPIVRGPAGYEDTIVDGYDIKFTDVNNPNNYFVARINNSKNVVGYSFATYTNALPMYGLNTKPAAHIVEKADGSVRIVYIDGARYAFNLEKCAGMGQGTAQDIDYTVSYNPTKQIVYVRALRYNYETGARTAIGGALPIGYLNCAELYGEDAELFKGFSTNKFTISISAYNLASSTCNFDIYGIGNMTGDDLMAKYDINNIEDNTDPVVNISVEPSDLAGVYTVVGSKFAIPKAEVIDVNPINEISVKVFKNYESSNPIYVAINGDNTFNVAEKAAYTIEYTAYDKYGNKGVSTLKVNPVNKPELIAGDNTVNNEFRLVFDNPVLKTGTTFNGPIFKYFDTINKKSAVKLNVTVTHAGSKVFNKDYVYADFADGTPNFDFTPVSAGDYTFTYTYSDNINSSSYSKTVTCVASNEYRMMEEAFVNRAYILGATYQVPTLNIHKFADVIEYIPATPSISYDNGNTWTELKVGGTFKVGDTAIEGATSVMFKFELEGSGLPPYITDAKPIVDVRIEGSTNEITFTGKTANIDMTKYFMYDSSEVNIVPDTMGNAIVFKAAKTSGSAQFSFINPLTYNDRGEFLSIVSTRKVMSNFTSLTYILTDAHDSTNKLYFKVETIGSDTTVSVNGGAKTAISAPLFTTDANKVNNNYDLSFKFNFINKIVSYGGTEFTTDFALKNNRFYVDIVLGGINGSEAGLVVNSFGNQQFSTKTKTDNSNALVNFKSSVGNYSLGTKLVVSAPVAADILTPVLNSSLSVKVQLGTKKNSPFITDVNGVKLDGTQDATKDYVISIDEFDTYKVTYEAVDAAGKITSVSYRITGVDLVAPTITLNYGFTKDTIHNVTLGKPFSIEYTVTDDETPEDKIMKYVVLINDDTLNVVFSRLPQEVTTGKYDLITDTCTITRKGMYTLYIYAMDESRNASIATYKVNVQ